MEQKHFLETDAKEQKGEVLYFPYGVPPGVPFFVEGGKAEEYPTVEDVRNREQEMAMDARKRFCVYPKELSVAMFLAGEFITSVLVPFYGNSKQRMTSAYYGVRYRYFKVMNFFALNWHRGRILYYLILMRREKNEARREYLDMKLWHVDKKFGITSDWNFYRSGEDASENNPYYEPVKTYRELESEIGLLEAKIKRGAGDEEERKHLYLEAKERHRLAYRQLMIIEGILRGATRDFCDSLTELAEKLKEAAEALGAAEDEIKKEVEKQAPFLREKYGKGAVRVYKLLLDYDRQPLLWIWFRSGRDFFRFWSAVRFLEEEKIIAVERNQPVRFRDELKELMHGIAEEVKKEMEKQKAKSKLKESDSILHKPLSRKEITSIIVTGLFLNAFFSVTVTLLMREPFHKDYPADILEENVYRYPERITAKDIFVKESNLEVRRVMMEMVKNETFLRQARARVIDERDGLKLFSIWVAERVHFNLVQCVCPSTLRVYYLRVPPEIRDANTAIAWTFGETGESYQPVNET